MTELEFEKACRGTGLAVANEYAWGSTGIADNEYTIINGGTTSEAIAPASYSTTVGNAAYILTIPLTGSIIGPLRLGIFAGTPGNTGRVTAGATYYGIMEMSGNLRERPVTVGNTTGRTFAGAHGNGTLDAAGNADASNWPGTGALGAGFRGGSWSNAGTYLRVSDRVSAANTSDIRSISYGGRGIRLVP
jgi:formylglycine-generating enzyme required for sulfatase activity